MQVITPRDHYRRLPISAQGSDCEVECFGELGDSRLGTR